MWHNSGFAMQPYHTSEADPIYFREGTWGFFDETWTEFYSGYDTEEIARAELANYIDKYLR